MSSSNRMFKTGAEWQFLRFGVSRQNSGLQDLIHRLACPVKRGSQARSSYRVHRVFHFFILSVDPRGIGFAPMKYGESGGRS